MKHNVREPREEEDIEEELIMREKEELEDTPVHAAWVQLTAMFGSSQSITKSFYTKSCFL